MGLFDKMIFETNNSLKKTLSESGKSLKESYAELGKKGSNWKEDEYLTLKHYFGKGLYQKHKLIHRKIKRLGVVPCLLLTYGSIVAITKYFLPSIKPLHACIFATVTYAFSFYKSSKAVNQYYSIQFTQYGVLKGKNKVKFYGTDSDKNGNIVYKFKTTMSLSCLQKNIESIEMILNTNVIKIKQNTNKKFYDIVTNPILIDNKKEAKNSTNTLGERVKYAYKKLGIEISDVSEDSKNFKKEVSFNCNETKKKVANYIEEVEHLTAEKNLAIFSDKDKDFKIIKEKSIGIISFGDLIVNTKLGEDRNIIVGVSENKQLQFLDIKKIYHSIVAGSTGYGKSNLSHVLITSMLKSDIDCSFFLLDPKKSELKRYRDIRRVFYTGDRERILEIIESIVQEMDRRNELFDKDKFVNNLETYNNSYPRDKLGYMIVYIEEIADLMISSDKEYSARFKDLITRLAQLGRSAGIRLFLSTQYPKAEILPTLIKNNCITRFGFAVSNSVESSVIMDDPVLTSLRKKGEMYLKNGDFTKIKVPYVEDKDIVSLITYLEQRHDKNGKYPLGEKYVSIVSNAENSGDQGCHYEKENVVTSRAVTSSPVLITNCNELLQFYITNCDNEVYSLNKTAEMTSLGRTKLQEMRRKLIQKGFLETVNGKTYLKKELKLRRVK